jgi:PIN domain nuclease of toxin-antitoxin system
MESLLLDTHALLWRLAEPDRLSAGAYAAIANPDNRVLVSAASGREIATKVRLGKLPHRDPFDRLLAAQAELEHHTLVSLDPALQNFPCELLW